MDKKKIGLKIKELRSQKGIDLGYRYTGEMLANDLGISRSYLGDIERGRTLPSPELILKLSNIFNVSKDYFQDLNTVENEEIDDELKSIAMDIKKLPDDKKDLLKNLIKTLSESNSED